MNKKGLCWREGERQDGEGVVTDSGPLAREGTPFRAHSLKVDDF